MRPTCMLLKTLRFIWLFQSYMCHSHVFVNSHLIISIILFQYPLIATGLCYLFVDCLYDSKRKSYHLIKSQTINDGIKSDWSFIHIHVPLVTEINSPTLSWGAFLFAQFVTFPANCTPLYQTIPWLLCCLYICIILISVMQQNVTLHLAGALTYLPTLICILKTKHCI